MTHHTAKANLEKGFSWPSEAIPYGLYLRVDFWYPKGQNPHLGPDPRCPQVLKPPVPIQLLNKDNTLLDATDGIPKNVSRIRTPDYKCTECKKYAVNNRVVQCIATM